MAPDIAQARLWKTPSTRKILSQSISNRDLATCRLVCRKLAVLLAPLLFADITIHFCSSTLPGPSRMAFLERIGRHIEAMAFKIPHSAVTFLPPILDPVTVAPQTFIYRPRHPDAYHSSPKYGSQEMTGWLVKQYSPLFHAATNKPTFIKALALMKSLRHLRISCEGQMPSHRYRRSAVDYALISLRMAMEQAPLTSLTTLSLLSIHPGAVLYLQPNLGFGASPGSRKRWSQIRHLTIRMTSFPCEAGQPTEQTTSNCYTHTCKASQP